jgi:hypothetical protein
VTACARLVPHLVLAVALALAGCTSVPQAAPERDVEAKQFGSQPDTSALYVYRNDSPDIMETQSDVTVYANDRLIGQALPGGYFRVDLRPGSYVLHGYGPDQGRLKISTRPGEVYFVSLNVVAGNSVYRQVAPDAGKREIARCCVLMENWRPGQRPVLR